MNYLCLFVDVVLYWDFDVFEIFDVFCDVLVVVVIVVGLLELSELVFVEGVGCYCVFVEK